MRKRTRRIAALGLSLMLVASNFVFAYAVEPEGTTRAETTVEQPSKENTTVGQSDVAEGDSKADHSNGVSEETKVEQLTPNQDLTPHNKENAADDQLVTQTEEDNQETTTEDTKVTSDAVVKVPQMVIPFEEGKVVEIPLEVPEGWDLHFPYNEWYSFIEGAHYNSEEKVLSFEFHYSAREDMKVGVKDIELLFTNYKDGTSQTNTNIKIKFEENIVVPKVLLQPVISDGMSDAVFKIDTGSGDYKLTEITEIAFYGTGGGISATELMVFQPQISRFQAQVDLEKGTITLKAGFIQWLDSGAIQNLKLIDGNTTHFNGNPRGYGLVVKGKYANGWEGEISHSRNPDELSDFVYKKSARKKEMPSLKETYQEVDGSKDMTLTFNPGSGDYAIKEIKGIEFWAEKGGQQEVGTLQAMRVGTPTSFQYDLKNGTLTLKRHALASLLYGKFPSVGITYIGSMEVLLANGKTCWIHSESGKGWKLKSLEKSKDAVLQHLEELPSNSTQISKDKMKELVDVNKEKDIVITIPNKNGTSNIVYSFAKGTMKMVDGKEIFDLGVEFITDFTQLKARSNNFKENEFVFRANFNYDGKLPAPAEISFQVDKKWVGQTVYYYQILGNGELSYTGQKAVIGDNGVYTVTQDHCSDYVGLTKAPKGEEENPQKPGTDDDAQTSNPVVKPVESKPEKVKDNEGKVSKTPKTGDVMSVSMLLGCIGAGVGSLGVVAAALAKKRKR